MRARFITNGILSLLGLIGLIMLIIATVQLSEPRGYWIINKDLQRNDVKVWVNGETEIYSDLLKVGTVTLIIGSFPSFVMGIITLSMIGRANQRELGIASGVIALLGGLFGVNAIVSFIGAAKENIQHI